MVPEVGQRIGPYEILGRLGSGGMGLVYSAWDARLQRDVAIKILREQYATPDMRSRFLQEARAASGLNHPNICTIFDIGEQDGDPFLVMELLKGETLRSRMNAGNLEVRDIIRVAHDVADALASAHGRGIIHRDIKPANVILVEKPGGVTIKVLDFGLAKIDAYGESVFDLTHVGTTVGTVSYMSPEQARGEALDARSDLFSLGVVLYEMATGRLPFRGATSALVFVELLSSEPDAIRTQNPLIPEDLDRLIMKLLEKDRTLRYQSAQALVQAVEQISFGGATGRRGWTPSPASIAVPQPSASSRGTPAAAETISDTAAQASPSASAIRRALLPVDPDKVIRPVRRVVGSESSAYHRVRGESSGSLPAAAEPVPASPAAAPGAEEVARVEETAYSDRLVDDSSTSTPVAARPIVPQSARGPQPAIPRLSLPRITSQRPQPRFQRVDDGDPVVARQPKVEVPAPPSGFLGSPKASMVKPRRWLLPLSVVMAVAIGVVAWRLWPSRPVAIEDRLVPIAVGPVQNTTGITALSSALTAGLALELAQSPQFQVADIASLAAGLQAAGVSAGPAEASIDELRKGSQKMGVTELLLGEIHNNGNSYTLGVRVRSVATGDELFHAEETAQSQPQIPDAIDRLVIDLRNGMSEPADELQRTSTPLSKDGTGNLDALSAYSDGLISISHGQFEAAAVSFENATLADANFTQAYLRLAEVYRAQHAQPAAATAANTAKTTSQNSSQRTQQLADVSYALNVTDDIAAVSALTGQLLGSYPNDVDARIYAAIALREQGKFPEALDMIQGALRRSPFNSTALGVAGEALLAQGRMASSRPMEEQAAHAGRVHPELRLLMDFVANHEQGPIDVSGDDGGRVALAVAQASLLDATGATREGLHRWQSIAVGAIAADSQKLASTASDALSYAALDRALLGECVDATSLAQSSGDFPQSAETSFRMGLTGALCGNPGAARSVADNLTRTDQQSFLAKNVYVPELIAVAQWKEGDPNAALMTLINAQRTDAVSLAVYLRGEMHRKAGQNEQAVADYQIVISHPGAAVLVNPLLPAIAQLGLARAYAAAGDAANSASGYAAFLRMWSGADPASPAVAEAKTHSVAK